MNLITGVALPLVVIVADQRGLASGAQFETRVPSGAPRRRRKNSARNHPLSCSLVK
jgi:hypothetical protein